MTGCTRRQSTEPIGKRRLFNARSPGFGPQIPLAMFLVLVILLLVAMELTDTRINVEKQRIEDSLVTSVLASLCADGPTLYHENTGDEEGDPPILVTDSPDKAYERFMDCMKKNFDANQIMRFGDELRLKRFVVYDVREDKVTITEYGPYGKTGQSVGDLGLVKAPNGVPIRETSAYAEISFMVKGLSDRQLEETDQCLCRLTHDYRPEP